MPELTHCDKTRFPTEEEAKDVLAYITRAAKRGVPVNPKQRVYKCAACGGWHLDRLRDA